MSTRSVPPKEAVRRRAVVELCRYFQSRHRQGQHGAGCGDPRIVPPYRPQGPVISLAAVRLDRECRRARAGHRHDTRRCRRAAARVVVLFPTQSERRPS